MPEIYTVDELLVNDSFISYCQGKSYEHTIYWEQYLSSHPAEHVNVEEARKLVLAVTGMLQQNEQELALKELQSMLNSKKAENDNAGARVIPIQNTSRKPWYSGKLKWIAVASVAAVGFLGLRFYDAATENIPQQQQALLQHTSKHYETKYGEKKKLTLPDGSTVTLNAFSSLEIDQDFGISNRNVSLTGEALFDVTHDATKPFNVVMPDFKVKVLGTLFNVKAYPGDDLQETSLIRGKVEIVMNNNQQNGLLLKPNEKAVISRLAAGSNDDTERGNIRNAEHAPLLQSTISPVNFNSKDSSVSETSWVYGRMDIYDKRFIDFKTELERLYNVEIIFKDKQVAEYRFSATFEKEDLGQVLEALKLSYPFNYKLDHHIVIISK